MSPSRWPAVLLLVGLVVVVVVVVVVDALPHQVAPSPLSSSSSLSFPRQRRQVELSIDDQTLICLLLQNDEEKSNCSATFPANPFPRTSDQPFVPSAITPAPPPSCRCVPHWQCNDEKPVTAVEGNAFSSFVLDLRTNSACGAPEEVCCMNLDLNAPPPTPPPTNLSCGQRNILGVGNTFLGFTDHQTQFGEFPWTVALVSLPGFGPARKPLFVSGGSLIHPQVVLTVAHKMKDLTPADLRVRLGEWNLETQTEAVPHQEIEVSEVLLHPSYNSVYVYYDVALLVLQRPAVLGPTVNTICLPSTHQHYLRDRCVVSGWGKKNFDKKSRFQKVMKKVLLPLVEHGPCQTALQGTRLGPNFILHDSFLCAGGEEEGQDACTGDGGSPLVCPLQNDPDCYVQVGVVAWGIGCGQLGLPGVYADVAKVGPWIHQVISEKFGATSGTQDPPLLSLLDVRANIPISV